MGVLVARSLQAAEEQREEASRRSEEAVSSWR